MGSFGVIAAESETMTRGLKTRPEAIHAFVDAGIHCLRHLIVLHKIPVGIGMLTEKLANKGKLHKTGPALRTVKPRTCKAYAIAKRVD